MAYYCLFEQSGTFKNEFKKLGYINLAPLLFRLLLVVLVHLILLVFLLLHHSICKLAYYCLFEQSGTFKNEFKKLGYEAYDYDIKDEFGETDYICDLFVDIESAYEEKESIFLFLFTPTIDLFSFSV